MKNVITPILVLGLSFLCMLPSCKKDGGGSPSMCCPHDTTFAAMKEWVYFDEGTWWIYQEETTGEIDSLYVYDSLLDDTNEAFEYRMYSSWYDNDFIYRHNPTLLGGSNVSNCSIRRLSRSQAGSGGFVGSGLIANFPPIEGETSGNFNSFATGGGVWTDSVGIDLFVAGINFTDVVLFHVKGVGSENNDTTNFYLAKNIGIVRKEIFDINKNWNLIDYNIVQ